MEVSGLLFAPAALLPGTYYAEGLLGLNSCLDSVVTEVCNCFCRELNSGLSARRLG
jgi:hypothetical protein